MGCLGNIHKKTPGIEGFNILIKAAVFSVSEACFSLRARGALWFPGPLFLRQ